MGRFRLAAVCLITLAGCSNISIFDLLAGINQPPESGSSKLVPFTSEQEMLDYFAEQVRSQNQRSVLGPLLQFASGDAALGGSGLLDLSPPAATPTAGTDNSSETDAGSFSQTTIQEEGVDESDVVKTDGSYLYIMDEGSLKIVDIRDRSQMAVVGTKELEGYGQELYLHDGKVVALTSNFGGFFPIPLTEPAIGAVDLIASPDTPEYEPPSTVVTIIDVSTPETPVILSTTKFKGTQSASRMIDGVLHFVVASYPSDFVSILPVFEGPAVGPVDVTPEDVLPTYTQTVGDAEPVTGDVVGWQDVYRPTDPDGYGVVTLISLDVDADAAFTGVGVIAAPGLIYSSLDALYATDTQYNFSFQTRTTTDIYKFAYVDRGAEPAGSGSVPGRILNQYSMSEKDGYLRVATTLDRTFTNIGDSVPPSNNVYVLSDTGDGLSVVGSAEGIAPGETIQSARFVGDRGFLVTFRQVDPFFTLDLSDPTNPQVVGDLKVPGFSTFIVPMDDTHMLTVGQYIPDDGTFFVAQGVQLSIFDVSDFSNPVQSANVILGNGTDEYAYSEALYNPKAFTYFAEQDLVALPITIEQGLPFVDIGFATDVGSATTGSAGAAESTDTAGSEGSSVGSSSDGSSVNPTEPVLPGGGDVPPDGTLVIDPVIPDRFEGLVVFRVTPDGGITELGRIDTKPSDTVFYGSAFTRGVFVGGGDDVLAITDRVIRGDPVSDIGPMSYELSLD